MRNILIIRLSAMGDVAICAPVVKEYALQNPDCKFFMVSQPRYVAMFSGIENLTFIPLNTKKGSPDYCGSFVKLFRIAKELQRKFNITDIADIHNVIRTKILRLAFRIGGIKCSVINKHRKDREALCRARNKLFKPIIPSQRCMEEVFVKMGLKDLHFAAQLADLQTSYVPDCSTATGFSDSNGSTAIDNSQETHLGCSRQTGLRTGAEIPVYNTVKKIGIAPFAAHKGKEWPAEKMEKVIEALSENPYIKIFLYGGGKTETAIMNEWAAKYSNTEVVAGKKTLQAELDSMAGLDLMLSMDSANMHLASLVHTPVLCIWGATHPYAGYNGWGQRADNAIQIELPCRPCHPYGGKPCARGDYACLNNISPQEVLNKIYSTL